MIAFCHMVKTAGTTLNYILRNNYGMDFVDVYSISGCKDFMGRNVFSKEDLELFLKKNKKIKCIGGHEVKPYGGIEGVEINMKYLIFLRDPVKRYISHYNHQVMNKKNAPPFDEWIHHVHENNYQVKYIANSENLSKAKETLKNKFDFIGLTEEFDISLLLMKQLLKLPDSFEIRYQKKNVSRPYKNKDNFSQELIDKIRDNNELDIRLYEYVKSEVFEDQKNKYKGDIDKDIKLYQNSLHGFKFSSTKIAKFRIGKHLIYSKITP